ncbi:hypothetical protein [Streptomyces sp. NPDC102462]|uniref:hypothetical protein n=1 Tax=Streptomyces sp. NPDC102462 TaxID=3366178 RepID=UPI00381A8A2C
MNGTVWSLPGDGMMVADRMVHLRRTDSPRAEHAVCLLAPGHGRWDLPSFMDTATADDLLELSARK